MSGALMRIQLRGGAAIARELRASERALRYAERVANRRTAFKARAVARETVPGTRFDQSIFTHHVGRGTYRVASDARAAESIHEGRRPGRPPSIRQLLRWIDSRNIAASVSAGPGRRVTRRKYSASETLERDRARQSLAHRLQETIRERGTAPIRFFAEAVDRATHEHERYMREALQDALKKSARGIVR